MSETMSDPVRPATREEVERLRQSYQDPSMCHSHIIGLLTCLGPRLLALIDQMADLLHDARQEAGYTLGRAEKQREVLEVLAARHAYLVEMADGAPSCHVQDCYDHAAATVDQLRQTIAERGEPALTPPPAVQRQALQQCVKAMEKIEWNALIGGASVSTNGCPACYWRERDGMHDPNCPLAAALAAARAAS